MDPLESVVLDLLREKLSHFRTFAQVAKYKGEQSKGQASQYKTEKWLQTELVVHLWARGMSVIPEYTKEKWDIYVPASAELSGPYFLALKCLSDSDQNPNGDYKSVEKDLNSLVDFDPNRGKVYMALILPLSLSVQRGKYLRGMLSNVENYARVEELEIRAHKMTFVSDSLEGIVFMWIEPKSQIR